MLSLVCLFIFILQWALATGLLGLQRASDIIIATLCKFTVPHWHGQELMLADSRGYALSTPSTTGNSTTNVSTSGGTSAYVSVTEMFRWRHVQAAVRLLQVVHVLADVIADWDAVMDCFEQLSTFIQSSKSVFHDDVTPLELDKISTAIERFKHYTVFVTDEALVRLMASLVALSLNSLAVSATASITATAVPNMATMSSTSATNVITGVGATSAAAMSAAALDNLRRTVSTVSSGLLQSQSPGLGLIGSTLASGSASSNPSIPLHMQHVTDTSSNSVLSYSLLAAVEIAKCNAYRISCIWQMVVSHLRMIASHKVRTVS